MPNACAMPDIQIISILGVIVAAAAVVLGYLSGKEPAQQMQFRKYLHILACGACTLCAALLSNPQLMIPAVVIAEIILLYLVFKRDFFTIKGEKSYGIVLFPLAFLLLLFLFPHPQDKALILGPMGFLTLADALAALVGMRFAKRNIVLTGDKKSWIGAVAFFVTAFIWMWVLRALGYQETVSVWVFLAGAVAISGISAFVELMGSKGRDNLWIPLVSAWLMYLWAQRDAMDFVVSLAYALALVPAGIFAFYKKWLSFSGTVAAIFLGIVLWVAGFSLWPMLVFFLTGSLLGKLPGGKSSDIKAGKARDHIQVYSNGGLALLLAVAHSIKPLPIWEYLYLISAAVACSDTWSSEIGQRFSKRAFDLRSLRWIPAGLSGCISGVGTLAAIMGAACIAAYGANQAQMLGILLLGFAGSVLDSVLGAFVQARYGKEVAQDTGEGKPNKGFARVTNDVVNALSGLGIAGLAALIFYL
jgi:uncharacterized protein (TIGR00297 family)